MSEGAPVAHAHPRVKTWFRGGLVFKAHRLVYHSTLGWRVRKMKEEMPVAHARPNLQEGEPAGGLVFKMCCGTEEGSCLRLVDSCITQLKAQGPSRTCNESTEDKEGFYLRLHIHVSNLVQCVAFIM